MRVLFTFLACSFYLIISQGPTQPISSLKSPSPGTFFAGSNDGRVTAFTVADGALPVTGDPHRSQVVGFAAAGGQVYSAGFDDAVRSIDVGEKKFSYAFKLTL